MMPLCSLMPWKGQGGAGRCTSRMRPSRETCLHRKLPLGMGNAIWPLFYGFFSVPPGRDAMAPSLFHLIKNMEETGL